MHKKPAIPFDPAKQIALLRKEALEILSLDPDEVMERVLSSSQPAALIHALPEVDLHLLICDVSKEDRLTLLSLASDRQWEYVIDVEIWHKARIDLNAAEKWFALLYKINPSRLMMWIAHAKIDLLELFLYRHIEIIIREHDQNPNDFGENIHTIDDVYYFRIKSTPLDSDLDSYLIQKRTDLLCGMLKTLAAIDHTRYQAILTETIYLLPAEIEEEAFRMRNVRQAEKGFLPFDEAVGIYQPLGFKEIEAQLNKLIAQHRTTSRSAVIPQTGPDLSATDSLLAGALNAITDNKLHEKKQLELTALINQMAVADGIEVRSRATMQQLIRKAAGFINVGLEHALKVKETGEGFAAIVVQRYALLWIFRVGHTKVMELNKKALQWRRQSWFAQAGLALAFWGESWLGVLGGVLIRRPLFYDNYRSGVLYREFETLEEIESTKKILTDIFAYDQLLKDLAIDIPGDIDKKPLTHENLLLTAWACDQLNLKPPFAPLSLDQFKKIYTRLWARDGSVTRVRQSIKAAIMEWLVQKTGKDPLVLYESVGHILENLCETLEQEYGNVSIHNLEPRYIPHFLIRDDC